MHHKQPTRTSQQPTDMIIWVSTCFTTQRSKYLTLVGHQKVHRGTRHPILKTMWATRHPPRVLAASWLPLCSLCLRRLFTTECLVCVCCVGFVSVRMHMNARNFPLSTFVLLLCCICRLKCIRRGVSYVARVPPWGRGDLRFSPGCSPG